jgi:serine/threonine protein kinase
MELCLTEDCAIKITDFGQSIIYADGQRMDESFKTTFSIAAPEVIFTARTDPRSLGPAIDVWAFACTLANILGDDLMFSSSGGNTDQLFFKWVRALGKFPDEWWGRWEGRSEEFEEDGSFKPDPDEVYFENSLRQRLVDIRVGRGRESAFGLRELDALEVLFGKMLKYHASERITAEEIVGLIPVAWEKGIFV